MKSVKTLVSGLAGLSALALFSGNVLASAPGAAANITLNMSGASAQRDTIKNLFSNYCNRGAGPGTATDTLDVMDGSPTGIVMTCTLGAGVSPASYAGQTIRLRYRTAGGSIYGVNPVARTYSISLPDDQGCTRYTAASGKEFDGVSGARAWSCTTGTSAKSVAGAADTEVDLFAGPNLPPCTASDPTIECPSGAVGNWAPLTAAEKTNNIDSAAAYGVIFGIAVNNGVSIANNSLSYNSIQKIFKGDWYLWDQVPEVYQGGAGTAGPITICRRVAGSGTQTFAQVHFNRQGCVPKDPNEVAFVAAPSGPNGNPVNEISSSSTILSGCVDTTAGALAISSTEKQPGAKYGTNWRYVSIDGVAPTDENAALGAYTYWVENSFNVWKGLAASNPNLDTFVKWIRTKAEDKQTLVDAGLSGVLAIPFGNGGANQPDPEFDSLYDPANPTNFCTRGGNACAISTCMN